jgi:hypothetical protein
MTVIQAIFGWYHHRRFVQDKPTRRRWFTHVHLWLGRALILGGSVNCGFGFPHLDANYKWAVKGWILCGIVIAIYICLYILLEYSRKSGQGVNEPEGQISEVEGLLERDIEDPMSFVPLWNASQSKVYSQQVTASGKPYGEEGAEERSDWNQSEVIFQLEK